MHTSGKGCCDVAYQSQLQAWTNWQQWAVHQMKVQYGNHIMMPVLCSDTTQPFIALFSFRGKPEPCETVSLLDRMKRAANKQRASQTTAIPFYCLGTFQTVLEMQHSGIVFLLRCYHSICNYLQVSHGCKTALENTRKTETFAYTCIWEIQGLQLREESEWRQEQPALGRGCISGLRVTACPSSSTCTSSSKKR